MNQIEKIIDIATWNRKEHFEHFSAFDDPFFGVTVNVDCTRAYREAKNKGVSFSLLLLLPEEKIPCWLPYRSQSSQHHKESRS